MIELSLLAGLVIFYIINLALGLYQGRNVRTAYTYVFGHRYSTGVLLLTLTGTFIGGGHLTNGFRTGSHDGGGFTLLWFICIAITSLLASLYVFPKLRRFKNWYTLGDIARQAYGSRYAQLVVDGISVVSSIILLSAQLVALKRISTLLGIGDANSLAPYLLIISFTLVVIAYASRAGTPGVVSTDVLQMILVIGGTAFIAYTMLNLNLENVHTQGLSNLWYQVKKQSPKHTLFYMYFFQKNPSLTRISLSALGAGLLLFSPPFIKRVGMANSNRQMQNSMLGFTIVVGLFMFMILICGFGLFIIHGKAVGHSDVYPTLLKAISNHLWMKMLLLMMFMAVVMSTADSVLTATSVCAVHFMLSFRHDKDQLSTPSLTNLRLANMVVGLLALVLALLFMRQPVVDFVVFARSILGALIPFLIGISLGIKKSSKALLGSIACFGLLFIGSIILVQIADLSFIGPRMIEPTCALRLKYKALLPFVILLSILAYVLFEMIAHKGLKWEEREKFTEDKPGMIKRAWLEVKKFLGNPVLWAEEKMDAYESRGVLLILICTIAFLTSQFIGMPLHPTYLKPMTVLMLSVFVLCTFNLFPEEWYQKLRRYYALYWILSLVVCLPFAFLLRWLYHPTSFNALYLVFVPVIMQFFIGPHLSVTLALLGYVVGFGVYSLTADASVILDHAMLPLAGLLCTTLLTWIGGGYHMQQRLKRASRPKLWASSWGHDMNHLFMEAQMETSLEYNPLPKEQKAQGEEAKKRLQIANKHMKNASNQAKVFRNLVMNDNVRASEIENVLLSKAVSKVCDALPDYLKALVHIKGTAPIKVKVFKTLLENVIMNLIRNPYQAGATEVVLDWSDKPILYIRDNASGIAKEKLATLFEPTSNRDGTGLGLPFIKEALAKMGALIDVQSSDQGTEFMILFEKGV